MAYFAYFHSVIIYEIIFCGNATTVVGFQIAKRLLRIMSGAEPKASCKGLFRKPEILPVPCQYLCL